MIGGPASIVFGPLGPIAGGFIGAFVAVVAYELYKQKNMREALRAGWGSFVGRMAGIVERCGGIPIKIEAAWGKVFEFYEKYLSLPIAEAVAAG